MITGGTGFIGSHTVAELVNKGHEVRLLARKPERVQKALKSFDLDDQVESVVGDVTDEHSIEKAAKGCDATIHCGSVYSLDPRMAKVINKTNVSGTDIVIRTAHKLGHDPIVHVSSIMALIGKKCDVLSPSTQPGNPKGAYNSSKAKSDIIARGYQKEGIPVVITYPGSVWGPNDPHLGESCQMAISILKRLWSITPKGMVSITDVRDLAKLHAAIMEKDRGPRRYIAPVVNMSLKQTMALFESQTGRKIPTLSLPPWMLLWPMRVLDYLQKFIPFRFPVNYQAVYCVGLASTMDDSKTREEFGILPRPVEETLADTIRWMVKERYLSPNLAGRLA